MAASSARAEGVGADVVPHDRTVTFPDVHSIFFADRFGLEWSRALTWDPAVLHTVDEALAD